MTTFSEGLNLVTYSPDPAAAETLTPVILFLHGKGERGDGPAALPAVARWGLPRFREERRSLLDRPFPFRVVVPQCPTAMTWCDPAALSGLDQLIDDLLEGGVDPTRLYLAGFSMGGIGAFCLAMHRPHLFAALVSVCGACQDAEALPRLAHMPFWIAYGEDDEIAELTAGSRDVVARLRGHGRLVEKAYRLGHHGDEGPHVRTCDAAFAEPALYDWLLGQRLTA